jgi:hypothetical protein
MFHGGGIGMTGLVESKTVPSLPPILAGRITPEVKERVEQFYFWRLSEP